MRIIYVALAGVTIGAGLAVHLGGTALAPAVRDVLGDALWAGMMVWIVSASAPFAPLWSRAAAALLVCFAVEFSQLVHVPSLDALRGTRAGHLVLGSGFDPRDLAAYAAGVGVAAIVAAVVPALGVGHRADERPTHQSRRTRRVEDREEEQNEK